jgi:hypothetical protein
LLTFHSFKKIAMLSNTGGKNDRDNSSTGAVVVGDPKCADDTEVSAGVAVLSEAPAFVSGGSGLIGWEAKVTGPGGMADGPGGMADVGSVAEGTVLGVSPPDQTQGYAGGYREILQRSNIAGNSEVFIAAPDAVSELFVAARDASSMACVFDYSRHCSNVNDQPKPSSIFFIGTLGSAKDNVSSLSSVMAGVNKETDSCVLGGSTLGAEVDESSRSPVISQKPRQYFKKKSRKLCRKIDRRQTCDRKRTTFDHHQYHIMMVTNQVSVPSNMTTTTSTSNRGHSPIKAEVKKMNQHLIDENLCLKKDFHKADHRLKTLLADKKDLLRRLRLESNATNELIQSIQDEAQDTMERARDILSKANRSKKDEIQLKDEIDKSRSELLGVRMDLRKQSARLKKQAARMTETHNRRKRALAEQRKEIVNDVNTEKQQWNVTIRLAEKKMMSSLKQLQNERVMWQVLSQEAELRCDDAKLEVLRQKSNGRTLVQMQVDKAIRKERELKSYMFELQEIHAVQLLRDRKANRAAIQSSKYW